MKRGNTSGAGGIGSAKMKPSSIMGNVDSGGTSNNKAPLKTIMHIDMDCFFASVALLNRPEYRSKPVVICHSKGTAGSFDNNESVPSTTATTSNSDNNNNNSFSTSEIASCNYVARKYGIRNGMLLGKAQHLLSQSPLAKQDSQMYLISLPYEFEKYDEISKTLYKILCESCDDIMVVSCDEAYIDVSSQVVERGAGREVEIAERIRERVFKETGGCCASIGIGENMVVARIATKKAKPDGVCLLVDSELREREFVGLSVGDLPGVGYALTKHMDGLGIKTCGDLMKLSIGDCKKNFGEANGLKLYQFARGIDTRPLENKARQSIGAEINWGIRFQTPQEVQTFLAELTHEVYQRMEKSGVQGRHITIKLKKKLYEGEPMKFLGCGHCLDLSKSKTLEVPFRDEEALLKDVVAIYKELGVVPTDLRGVGIHVSKLVNKSAAMKGQMLLSFGVKRPASVVDEDVGGGQGGGSSVVAQTTPKKPRLTDPVGELFPAASQIDWSIVDGLPEEIRAEIMALKNPTNSREGSGIGRRFVSPAKTTVVHQAPPPQRRNSANGAATAAVPAAMNALPKLQPAPSLLGRSTFSEVNKILKDWVKFSLEPNESDTARVRKYLKALVTSWESEKCINLLRCLADEVRMQHGFDRGWWNVLLDMKEDVNNEFMREYGSGSCIDFI
ncbi:UNVERIFIED_CONTAM: hypothetical protein HDU68_005602 [Siphonaria sp. JEL0065]|nr:hypothetical protein HDU68_005602 [Siphonaria sp. JEL0065]